MSKKEEKGAKKPTEQAGVAIVDNFDGEVSAELIEKYEDCMPSAMIVAAKNPERENETTQEQADGDAIVALAAAKASAKGKVESIDVNGPKDVKKTETTDEQYKKAAVVSKGTTNNTTQGNSGSERE